MKSGGKLEDDDIVVWGWLVVVRGQKVTAIVEDNAPALYEHMNGPTSYINVTRTLLYFPPQSYLLASHSIGSTPGQ